jgi:P27 family predicted phage terminase small subunit
MAGNRNSGGRNRKPRILKEMQGSLNVTRDNHPVPQVPEMLSMSMPTDLRLTEYGSKVWDQLAPNLVKAGILKETDIQAFAVYCNEYARYLKMAEYIFEHGETYMTATGNPSKRPEVSIMNEALKVVNSYQTRFGLTPADRDRIKVEKENDGGIESLIT